MKLDLRSNEHCSSANKLQFGSDYRHKAEETVNVGHSKVQGFSLQSVLLSNLNHPLNKNGPHCVSDVRLPAHVVGFGAVFSLKMKAWLENGTLAHKKFIDETLTSASSR